MINRRKENIHTAIEYLFIFLCRDTYLIAILYCACSSMEATPFEILSLNSLMTSYLEPIKENNTVKTVTPIPNIAIAKDSILSVSTVSNIQFDKIPKDKLNTHDMYL